jgi:hypothetical protein
MTDRFCDICQEYIPPMQVNILSLKDDKGKHEVTGHKNCIDELEVEVKSLKNLPKLKVDEIRKLINI